MVRSPGLAQFSYVLGSEGGAVVVDPRRDFDGYLDVAARENLRIKLIVETHIHEDFLVGSSGLAAVTGATILRGPGGRYQYGREAREGEKISIGRMVLWVLETPGHTPESISLVVADERDPDLPLFVFSGDALMAGTVGRTDLFGAVQRRRLSARLYGSLHDKVLPLGDDVMVYPTHGQGSACGVGISDRDVTTIGYERKVNRVLGLSQSDFVEAKMREHTVFPPYFRRMEALNPLGRRESGSPPAVPLIDVNGLEGVLRRGQVIDVRTSYSFAGGHVPGSLNIWAGGLGSFVGWFVDDGSPVAFVNDAGGDASDLARSCYRCGYDRFGGMLSGGFTSWASAGRSTGRFECWSCAELRERLSDPSVFVLDVRESATEVIPGAHQVYVGLVPVSVGQIPVDKTVVVYCEHGMKTGIVVSWLRNRGYPSVMGLSGGYAGWRALRYPVVSMEVSGPLVTA